MTENIRWIHPSLTELATDRRGPFLALPDGGLATIDDSGLRTSSDDGATWSVAIPVCPGVPQPDGEPASHYLLRTGNGTLILLFLSTVGKNFRWNNATGEPKPDCRGEIWAIRSHDDGRTWSKPVLIARQPGELCYPYIFERFPGEIWITAGFTWLGEWGGAKAPPFRVKIGEKTIEELCRT